MWYRLEGLYEVFSRSRHYIQISVVDVWRDEASLLPNGGNTPIVLLAGNNPVSLAVLYCEDTA